MRWLMYENRGENACVEGFSLKFKDTGLCRATEGIMTVEFRLKELEMLLSKCSERCWTGSAS